MKKTFFFILIMLILPIKVNAATISINCNKTKLQINEEAICKIEMSKLDFIITSISGNIIVGDNLTITSSSYDNQIWHSLDSKFDIKDINLMRQDKTKLSNVTVATFKVKASANATGTSSISINNITAGNSDYESVSLMSKTVDINFGNNNNNLSSLKVSEVDIKFDKNTNNYTATVDKDSVEIKATAEDSKAIVTGTGKIKLNYGENNLQVVVTAENGAKKTYTIKITRPDKRSTNNDLANIELSAGELIFDKNKTEYVVNVEYDVQVIDIDYELVDNTGIGELFGNKNLSIGENKFTIKVTAENGSIKEYNIKVIRATKIEVTNSNMAKDIIVTGYDIAFDKTKNEYIIKTNANKLDIEVILEDTKSKYEIKGNENLTKGSVISIIITDKDGNHNVYKINIESITEIANNNYLIRTIIYVSLLLASAILNVLTIIMIKKAKKQ